MRALLSALLLAAACSDRKPAPPYQAGGPERSQPLLLEHDFGVVPHGQRRTHEFLLDLDKLGEDYVPLRVHLECSCGHAELVYRRDDGTERRPDGTAAAPNLPSAAETVVVRIVLDTARREPADAPRSASRGFVALQRAADTTGYDRLQWPILLHFAIDAPVECRPFAQLDFGRIATCQFGELLTILRGDERHPSVRFGPVTTDNDALTATLEAGPDHTALRVRCQPGALGNHRGVVSVATDLPDGYRVDLAATWKVVPDLEASPLAKISFHAPLSAEQGTSDAARQFVLVTDHDPRRLTEFVVRRIVGADGSDATRHFEIQFVPVAGPDVARDGQRQRLHVRYLGGLAAAFRGQIVIGKPEHDAELPIDLILFPSRDP